MRRIVFYPDKIYFHCKSLSIGVDVFALKAKDVVGFYPRKKNKVTDFVMYILDGGCTSV